VLPTVREIAGRLPWYVPPMGLRAVTVSVVTSAVLVACGGGGDGAAHLSVERWASPNPGSVNAYWIDGPDGIVVVDGGRNVTGGQKIADEVAQRPSGRGDSVDSSASRSRWGTGRSAREVPRHPDLRVGVHRQVDARRPTQVLLAGPARRSDYAQTLTYPTETFASDAELRIAGLTLRTADFGPGESATATVYFEPASRALFGGDRTGNHVAPALIEANSCGWLMNLAALSGRFGDADTVYPGHGDPGPAAQADQRAARLPEALPRIGQAGGGARFRRRANPDRSRN
jgi:hypothetical protein